MIENILTFLGMDPNKSFSENAIPFLKWAIPFTIMLIISLSNSIRKKIIAKINEQVAERESQLKIILFGLSELSVNLNNALNVLLPDSDLRSKYDLQLSDLGLTLHFEGSLYMQIHYRPELLITPMNKGQFIYNILDIYNNDNYSTRDQNAVISYILNKIKK